MKIIKLSYIKAHSRVCGNCEDDVLQLYGESAEDAIVNYLNRGKTVDACIESLVNEYGKIPAAIRHAALLLVEMSNEHRTPITQANVNYVPVLEINLKPYMIL